MGEHKITVYIYCFIQTTFCSTFIPRCMITVYEFCFIQTTFCSTFILGKKNVRHTDFITKMSIRLQSTYIVLSRQLFAVHSFLGV
jgi:hypothetical protein